MSICTNCGHQVDRQVGFCEVCGARMVENTNLPAVPARPSKAKQIVGMALSIDGLAAAVVCAAYSFYPLIGWMVAPIALAEAIVGFVMSLQNGKGGFTSKFTRVGRKLGLAGIIVSAISIALSMIGTVLFFVLMISGEMGNELYYF